MATKNNKQNVTTKKKHIWQFAGFALASILLILLLYFGIKKFGKSDDSEFNKYYSSEDMSLIYYYDSTSNDEEDVLELEYVRQIVRDYKLNYVLIDAHKASKKEKKEIEDKLGIDGNVPVLAITQKGNLVAINQKFVGSNKLITFLIDAGMLEEGSTYKPTENLTFINYDDYVKIFDADEDSIVVIGQISCPYCSASKQLLSNIAKGYKLTVNYLDVNDFTRDEAEDFIANLPKLGYDNEALITEGVFEMPTLFIVRDGKIADYVEGAKSLEEYINYFKEQEFIKY